MGETSWASGNSLAHQGTWEGVTFHARVKGVTLFDAQYKIKVVEAGIIFPATLVG